ncbi:DUF3466 family protein [Micromonospora viridifaciens]|nr:DUF3466 family protein [Micromonospora viridifaciens]
MSEANGINDQGAVVGQDDTVFPFVWNPSQPNGTTGTSTRLPILPTGGGPSEATAMAINNNGDIVGFSDALDASGQLVERAVVWSGGGVRDLGTLAPDPNNPGSFLGSSRAVDINDAGLIVGSADTPSGARHAFLFDPQVGAMQDLGSLVSVAPDSSRATSINNAGQIVGVSAALDPNGNPTFEHGFLIAAGSGGMIDLGTFDDPNNPGQFFDNSNAFGINDNGMIVGTSDAGFDAAGNPLTGAAEFFANGNTPARLLPVQSDGFDVGPNNHVVGSFDAPARGFVLHSSTGLVDLTALPGMTGTVLSATGANAAGQVTAIADIAGATVGILIS